MVYRYDDDYDSCTWYGDDDYVVEGDLNDPFDVDCDICICDEID